MDLLRAGVIGLGVGAQHVQAYQELPGVEVAWCCDTDDQRLRAVADRYGVAGRTTRWQDLAEDSSLNMVSVCSPDPLHFEQAAALVRADKHVFCEKPMTLSVEEARTLVELVYEHGTLFGVGNVCRFMPQFALAAEYARQGKLGELFLVESDYVHDMREVFLRTPWRVDPQHPQNAIFGGGVHPIDLVRWAAGEAVEVFAYGNHKTVPEYHSEDSILISIKFANGCIGKVWISFGVQQRPHNQIPYKLYGTQGTIQTDSQHPEIRLFIEGMAPGQSAMTTIPLTPGASKPILAELEQFVDSIRNDRRPLVDVVQGARTVALMAAAQASLESGKPEPVSPIGPYRQLFMRTPSTDERPDILRPPMPELAAGYALRSYQPGDEAHWLRICKPEFGMRWDEAELRRHIMDKPWFCPEHLFFTTYQGVPVGVACAWQEGAEEKEVGNLHYIAVAPGHRGQKLGQTLVSAVLRNLGERGFKACRLSTDDFRWRAIRLYWAYGFRPDRVQDELDARRWNDVQRRLEKKG